MRKHCWHHTSIQLVSRSGNPCPDENRLSINFGVNKNLKGMAFMLKNFLFIDPKWAAVRGTFKRPTHQAEE